jgi:hypothetical protein
MKANTLTPEFTCPDDLPMAAYFSVITVKKGKAFTHGTAWALIYYSKQALQLESLPPGNQVWLPTAPGT